MAKYLVLEQTGGTVVGNVRRTLVEAHNVKDAITQALGVDDKGHIQATSTTDRLMVVEVARIATIDVHHHLPTLATMDELETVYERGGVVVGGSIQPGYEIQDERSRGGADDE